MRERGNHVKSHNWIWHSRIFWFLGAGLFLLLHAPVWAQTITGTIATGTSPSAVAVNPVTHTIYVANSSGGTVTVIDGVTNSVTATVTTGLTPIALAVNPVTNQIYVANRGCVGFQIFCHDGGDVTVIDGATNGATQVGDSNASNPESIAVNPVTNSVYVANHSGSVTVIDGASNSITRTIANPGAANLAGGAMAVNSTTNKIYVTFGLSNQIVTPNPVPPGNVAVIDGVSNVATLIQDPNAVAPVAVAVNPVTNKIYVANRGNSSLSNNGNITVIDGTTNATTTIADPGAIGPTAVAVNTATNKIYVANKDDAAMDQDGGVTVIDGATNAVVNVKDPNAVALHGVAVDETANKVYVANGGSGAMSANTGNVTVIDGASNTTITVTDPNAIVPAAVAADAGARKIYVGNSGSSNATVISGGGTQSSFTVRVASAGTGTGSVTSTPSAIDCGNSCSSNFAGGAVVLLVATPASGSSFGGWSGGCTGTDPNNCLVTVSSDATVTASFVFNQDFAISAQSAQLNIPHRGEATDTITIAPANNPLNSAISLTCSVSGPAPIPACSLSPASITPGSNAMTTTLTVTAPGDMASTLPAPTAPSRAALLPWRNDGLLAAAYGICLPLTGLALLGVGVPRKNGKRARGLWLLAGSLLAVAAVQIGCGGGGTGGGGGGGGQIYSITITATSATNHHSTTVTATVK